MFSKLFKGVGLISGVGLVGGVIGSNYNYKFTDCDKKAIVKTIDFKLINIKKYVKPDSIDIKKYVVSYLTELNHIDFNNIRPLFKTYFYTIFTYELIKDSIINNNNDNDYDYFILYLKYNKQPKYVFRDGHFYLKEDKNNYMLNSLNSDEAILLSFYENKFYFDNNYLQILRIGVHKNDVNKFLKYYKYLNTDITIEEIENTLNIKVINN